MFPRATHIVVPRSPWPTFLALDKLSSHPFWAATDSCVDETVHEATAHYVTLPLQLANGQRILFILLIALITISILKLWSILSNDDMHHSRITHCELC